MRAYTEVFRGPARSLLIASALARLTFGISGLAFLVYVEERTGSFGTAGLVVGAFGITSALLAPARGAIVDRLGPPALLATVFGYAVFNATCALVGPSGPEALNYVILGALAGASAPPVSAWTRASLAARLRGRELEQAYSVDGALEESAFVFGPLLAGVVIATASARAAILTAATLVIVASIAMLYARTSRDWRPPPHEPRPAERGRLNPALLAVITTLTGAGIAIGLFEVGVTAFAEDRGKTAAAGILIAAFSLAGIAGSVIYASREWRAPAAHRYLFALAWIAAGMALLPLAGSIVALAFLALVPGLAFTSAFIINSLLIVEHAARASTAAFAGVTTAVNGGFAIGGATGGALVEGPGTDAAFLVAAAAILASALVTVPLALRAPRAAGG